MLNTIMFESKLPTKINMISLKNIRASLFSFKFNLRFYYVQGEESSASVFEVKISDHNFKVNEWRYFVKCTSINRISNIGGENT